MGKEEIIVQSSEESTKGIVCIVYDAIEDYEECEVLYIVKKCHSCIDSK